MVLDAALLSGNVPTWILDDNPSSPTLYGIPILSSSDSRWLNLLQFRFTVAIGNNMIRRTIFQQLLSRGGEPCSVVHPSAIISPQAKVGVGLVVMAGAAVNPGAELGCNVILNTACSVDHDCCIGDHVHICPGTRLAGSVRIQELSMIGTGSAIIPGVKIGKNVVVGAGSLVNRDLPDQTIAFGNPARTRIPSR